jgi:hypothetical protein
LLLAVGWHYYKKPKSKEVQIRELIEELAGNGMEQPPVMQKFEKVLDRVSGRRTAAQKWHEACAKLINFGDDALPILIEHLDDERPGPSLDFNTPQVNEICRFLIVTRLIVYPHRYSRREKRKGADGKAHVRPGADRNIFFDATKGGFPTWITERKGRSFAELQLEVMEWMLAEEEKIGVAEDGDEEKYIAPLRRKVEELRRAVATKPKPPQ